MQFLFDPDMTIVTIVTIVTIGEQVQANPDIINVGQKPPTSDNNYEIASTYIRPQCWVEFAQPV